MNHQSNHDEIQIVNAELLQSRSNSIPPISSLISNIQTIPLSVDYNSNTINPSLIDFSLLDQSQHQDHQEPDQEIINEDDIGFPSTRRHFKYALGKRALQ